MSNSYEYWEKALADPKALQAREFTVTEEPQPGFYRTKEGRPVAVWQEIDGQMVMQTKGGMVDKDDQSDLWLRCAKRPVTEEAYYQAMETGTWPDRDSAIDGVSYSQTNDPEQDIDRLAEAAEAYGEILDDETSARAVSLRAAILEQHKRADTIREGEKAPHLKRAREVDEIWMPVVKKARRAADRLRALIEGWETTKRRKAREAEEARQATDARFAATVFSQQPAPSTQIRSGYGRAASVRERRVVTDIVNIDAAINYYLNDPRLRTALIAFAQADIDKKPDLMVPGFEVEMQAKVY